MGELSHVGYNNCYFCGGIRDILIHKHLAKKLKANMGVFDMEPCSECKKYMRQGIICISIKDDTKEEEMRGPIPNPYRTGSWIVVKEKVIREVFSGKLLDFTLKHRFAFIVDAAWDKLGFPRGEVNENEEPSEGAGA